MATCNVTAKISVNGKVIKSKVWTDQDVMKMSVTQAWVTRQFNAFLKDFNSCDLGRDKQVLGAWRAEYGEDNGFNAVSGSISGVNGRIICKRGIFHK